MYRHKMNPLNFSGNRGYRIYDKRNANFSRFYGAPKRVISQNNCTVISLVGNPFVLSPEISITSAFLACTIKTIPRQTFL